MDLTDPEALRQALRWSGITPSKGLGQHFLIDRASLERIVAATEITSQDSVLEIGPGLGTMTQVLAERASKVTAVEADPRLAEWLGGRMPPNVEVVAGDFMRFDLRALPRGYKVASNLPYYLTSLILRNLLETPNPPALMALLMQREVAERIVAPPGHLSILALSVQYYATPRIMGEVSRHLFWPAPKVDSAVLQIRRRPLPAFPAKPPRLWRLVKAGFGEKRKQLRNSLAGGLNCSVELIAKLLSLSGIPASARAQELSLDDWHRLYNQADKLKILD
jgi:16S rRNA (adenine1518-N6/adenine1519-N6)-dimethyltransferase